MPDIILTQNGKVQMYSNKVPYYPIGIFIANIKKLSSNFDVLNTITGAGLGLGVYKDGTIISSASGTGTVTRIYDKNFTLNTTINTEGGNIVEIGDGDNFYLARRRVSPNSLVKYDKNGTLLWSYDIGSPLSNEFSINRSLIYDSRTNRIYTIYFRNTIYVPTGHIGTVLDTAGNVIYRIGRAQFQPTLFCVTVTSDGFWYVGVVSGLSKTSIEKRNLTNGGIIFTRDSTHVNTSSGWWALDSDDNDNVYIGGQEQPNGTSLIKYDKNGTLIWSVVLANATTTNQRWVRYIKRVGDRLYLFNNNNQLLEYNLDGDYIKTFNNNTIGQIDYYPKKYN